jgi:hypothetical protein
MKSCDLKCGRFAHHRDETEAWTCKACLQLVGLEGMVRKRDRRYRDAMLDTDSARGIGVVRATTVRVTAPSRSYRQATQHDREIRYAHLPVRANGGESNYDQPPIPRAAYGTYPERIRQATTPSKREPRMAAAAPMTYAERVSRYGALGDANH